MGEEKHTKKRGLEYLSGLKSLFDSVKENNKRVAILTHAVPDPDAIGSMMGLERLFLKYCEVSPDCYIQGQVSHPQNNAMVNLLDPQLKPIEELDQSKYDIFALVDTVPQNAGKGGFSIKFDLVVDHHKEECPPDFSGVFVNVRAGSCCATICDMYRKLGMKLEEDDNDKRVATAMLVGIGTDTEHMMSDDATQYEFDAWSDLFEYRLPVILKKIINFERPKTWVEAKAIASNHAIIREGIGVVGMGAIRAKDRDMIADMSDEMITWQDVQTAISFAIVDGERLEGSVRSQNPSLAVPQLCKALGCKGTGGGKLGKGGYRYDLGAGAIEEEEDAELREQTWKLIDKKETARIFRVISKI